jgi:uncharacterized protein (DUF2147 family)
MGNIVKNKYIFIASLAFYIKTIAPLFAATSPIIGIWETEPKANEKSLAHVSIMPCKDNAANLCGQIVWLEEPNFPDTGKPKIDIHNPDGAKAKLPVMGMQVMWHFKPANESLTKYNGGESYSPRTGRTYRAELELIDNDNLAFTGHLSIFSQTQTWKRVKSKK